MIFQFFNTRIDQRNYTTISSLYQRFLNQSKRLNCKISKSQTYMKLTIKFVKQNNVDAYKNTMG